jgi:LysM repeat protein
MALATLASALAWSLPALAVEADTETEAAPSEEPVYHTLEPGETLTEIADRYGISIDSLIRENEITDPRKIWAGARLRIPASAERIPTLDAEAEVDTEAEVDAGAEVYTGDPESTEIASVLDRCETELRAARFEQALESAAEVRERLEAREGAGDDQSHVRLEIASATAYVALGQTNAALESLERDPALTSPKVLAVFRAARGRVPPPSKSAP